MSKVKDLFFVSEPKPETPKANNVEPVGTINKESFVSTSAWPQQPTPTVETSFPSTNEDVISQIWEVILSKNLPGPDYIELKNNVSALSKTLVGIPEDQIISAAFNVLKNQYPNLTKETILKSIDTYVGIVNEEKKNGLNQCKQLRINEVGEKESRVKQLKETANDILKQIEELKKRYDETNASANNLEHEILTKTQEIDAKEKTFVGSVEAVIGVLTNDKNKIATLNF